MFQIQPWSVEKYQAATRKSTLVVVVLFAVLAMLCATIAVQAFGTPEGDNFRYNLGGVLVGLALTAAILRAWLSKQPLMEAAVYGWQLKRSLMSVTNVMHCVEAGVAAGDEYAMQLLRFYHLGVTQMYQLDGNSSGLSQMVHEIDQHKAAMEARGLDSEQTTLYPGWIDSVKQNFPAKKA